MKIKDQEQTITYLVNKYANMLKRIAYQNLKIKSEAEDVVQDTFITLLSEDHFEDEEHIKAWLIRVVINKSLNKNKLAWVRKTVAFEDYHPDLSSEDREVWDLLEQLDAKHRNVIYLYYYEGYKIREIAELLNIKVNTVNSQLTRGREKLKKILKEDDYE